MLVIDAANVLHAAHAQPWPISELDTEGLVRLVGALRLGRRGAVLVFDGVIPPRPPPEPHGLRLTWSGRDREADDVIEELLDIDTAPARMHVVSSDRRLRNAARRAGAVSETSPDFLQRVYDEMIARGRRLPPPKIRQEVPLDRAMLEIWLEEFGFDPALARITEPQAPPTRPRRGDRLLDQKPRAGPRRVARQVARPPEASAAPPAVVSSVPTPDPEPDPDPAPPTPASPSSARRIDDELAALLKLWGSALSDADLNMQRWLETHPPPDPPARTPRGS